MLESRTFRVWLGAILLMGAIFCGYALAALEKRNATEEAGCTYRIGTGDQLDVSVWQHPELSKTVVVDCNGNISLPLVNVVKTSSLSVNDLAHALSDKLERVFPKPQVSVIVSKINSRPPCARGRRHPFDGFAARDESGFLPVGRWRFPVRPRPWFEGLQVSIG
jgi:protein involved in polysaccharide export with SLBB domain